MHRSFKAFMEEIIDYAGLFPPADLSLDTAIRNYARYRTGDDAWMLARFIIPAGRLEELEPYGKELLQQGPPFRYSLLGSKTETNEEFQDSIDQLAVQCRNFHRNHGDRVVTGLMETRLPREAALSCDPELILNLLQQAGDRLAGVEHAPDSIFYECYLEENWKKDIRAVLEAISRYNEQAHEAGLGHAGFKLRCGGVQTEMFPEVGQVAFAINRAREYGVAMKCTAGLHHPVRQYHESVQTRMHGFVNVFGGAMLAYAHDLSDEELIPILEEEDGERFSFSDDSFSWTDLSVTTGEIQQLREVAMISFGSCSFDEPREDLQQLGLL